MKKIQLQEWALSAEVLGGIAIVITLIFLVLETRATTNAIQAQTYQSLTSELNEIRREKSKSQYIEAYLKYTHSSLSETSDAQKFLLINTSEALWGIYESAFFSRERGVLGDYEWLRFSAAICRNYAIELGIWYPEQSGASALDKTAANGIARNITPKFKTFVETSCSK